MSVNILDQNGNLKKIAHGFSESKFNTFRSDVISNIEMTDTASKDYAVGDFLIMANGQLAQVTSVIYQDMTINLSNVRLTTVEEMIAAKADSADIPDVSKYQKIFTGTMTEWNQLTTEQKTAYDLANITDDLGTEADIVNAVTDGDMRAVTSNAVHDALESKISTSETVGLVKNDGTIDTKDYAEKVTSAVTDNFASLDANGNPADSGITTDQTTTSASGNPISIPNLKSAQIAKNPIITFEPIQAGSGTPSPSNVRAISGYDKIEVLSCKENIFDGSQALYDNKRWSTADGTLISANNYQASSIPIPVIGGASNYISVSVYRCYYDKNMTFLSADSTGNAVVTTPNNAVWMHISQAKTDWSSPSTTMVAISDTAITFEPYHKTTDLSESLGQTVYGLEWDVRSGKLSNINRMHTITSITEYQTTGGHHYIIQYPTAMKNVGSNVVNDCVSDRLAFTNSVSGALGFYHISNAVVICVPDSYSVADFNTNIAGGEIVFPIDASTETQLTPHEIALSQGYNYISTNGTSISLAYHNGELASLADVSQLGETVNELGQYVTSTSLLNGLIHSKEITVTTNASGLANINMDSRNVCIINMFIKSNTTVHYIALVDIYQINSYIVKALNGSDLTPVANQSITVVVYYYDLH